MTQQEIYDKVKKHLLTQNRKSCNENFQCVYRNQDGLKCAIGCLIFDEHYSLEIEYNNVTSSKVINALRMSGIECTDEIFNLLEVLQYVHDSKDASNWEEELYNVADRYNLTP